MVLFCLWANGSQKETLSSTLARALFMPAVPKVTGRYVVRADIYEANKPLARKKSFCSSGTTSGSRPKIEGHCLTHVHCYMYVVWRKLVWKMQNTHSIRCLKAQRYDDV